MATFAQRFEKAVERVRKAEKFRAKAMHDDEYRTYQDMRSSESDPDVLRSAASDCLACEDAYLGLARLAKQMSRAMSQEAERLERAAGDLDY